jgi:hypothetical protein
MNLDREGSSSSGSGGGGSSVSNVEVKVSRYVRTRKTPPSYLIRK